MSTIKDFEILNKLGEGSFSCVYKVKRISDGQFYAMKKVKMNQLTAKERENALNEIRILASLSSPNIIQYRDSIIDSDILCVIMDLAQGGDLTKMVEAGRSRGGVDEKEIWSALVQMTLGLKNLHDLKILHRDLKCANIFISEEPTGKVYKLGDLNISKVTKGGNAQTQAGTPCTLILYEYNIKQKDYAAPEIWRGDKYQSSCDIWSLGCIIYEFAASRPPFRANDLAGLNSKIQKGIFDPVPSKYSKDLTALISTMLRVNPTARPSCLQILQNPSVIKNSGSLLINAEDSITHQDTLLKTILLPRNLNQLKGNLPKAQYDDKVSYGRACSAGPRRPPEIQAQTPQPERKSIAPTQQPPQLQQQAQQVQQQQMAKPPQPQGNRPPIQGGKPPQLPPQANIQKDMALQQRVQQMENRLLGQQTPQSARNNPRQQSPSRGAQQNYQQQQQQYNYNLYNRAAGTPSGMGRRQQSAQSVGKR